jgi:hypothetical protein
MNLANSIAGILGIGLLLVTMAVIATFIIWLYHRFHE